MPQFIATRTFEDEDGRKVSRNWKRAELLELVRSGSSRIFEVTESHAQNVLRPQSKYQEVYEDIFVEAAGSAEAAESDDSHSDLDGDPVDPSTGAEEPTVDSVGTVRAADAGSAQAGSTGGSGRKQGRGNRRSPRKGTK